MQQKPDLNCELATELVSRLYGLKVLDILEMVSFDDRNFHIQVSSSHENPYLEALSQNGYTLKVMSATKTAKSGHFESVHHILHFLDEKGMRVPLPIMNLRGRYWSTEKLPLVRKHGSTENSPPYALCGVQILTYIPGDPIGTILYTEDILRQWGRLLGQFQNCLMNFSNEYLFNKDIFWNLYHIPEIVQFMEGLDKEKSELVLDVLWSYDAAVKPLLHEFPKGYIHGDFNETNILVRKVSDYVVDGILDLEDAHYGPYIWDVALMLMHVSLDCDSIDPIEAMGQALAGYLEHRTISRTELSLLKICIACRLCQSLVMGAYHYRLDPKNSHLLRSSRSGWSRLKLIWSTQNEVIIKRWNEIRQNVK